MNQFVTPHHPVDLDQLEPLPCTTYQQRIWADAMHDPDNVAVLAAFRWRVKGPITTELLEHALNALVARHEVLRTIFQDLGEGVRQLVLPRLDLPIEAIDISTLSAELQSQRLDELGLNEARKPMNVSTGPLIRALLVTCGPNDAMLHLTLHSLVADGWSIGLLMDELGRELQAASHGEQLDLPEPELHYADYALWQEELLESGALNDERNYWAKQLSNLTRFSPPTDHERPQRRSGASFIRSMVVPEDVSAALDALTAKTRYTHNTILSAAIAAVMHVISGARDIQIGAHVAGRSQPELEPVIGPVYNPVIFRYLVNGDPTIAAFAEYVQGVAEGVLAHQQLPYEKVLDLMGSPAKPGDQPVCLINANYQKLYISQTDGQSYDPFDIVSIPSLPCGPIWDLNFFMVDRNDGRRLSCEGDGDLYEHETIDELLDAVVTVIRTLYKSPQTKLSELSLPIALRFSNAITASGPTTHGLLGRAGAKVMRLDDGAAQANPFIVINDAGRYLDMAKVIGEQRPMYCAQLYDAFRPEPFHERPFQDIASEVVELVRSQQPRGPYALGGFCVAGCLAYEAARQLQDDGEEIAFVAIFDSWAPRFIFNGPAWRKEFILRSYKLNDRQWQLRRLRRNQMTTSQWLHSFSLLEKLGLLKLLRKFGMKKTDLPADPFGHPWFQDSLQDKKMQWTPPDVDFDVLLVRSQELRHPLLNHFKFGWPQHAKGRLSILDVPGDHWLALDKSNGALIGQKINAMFEARQLEA